MRFKVTIQNPDGSPLAGLDAAPGRTILEMALGADVDYPHGCRSGNCGACKSHLLSGEIEMSPYSEFALNPEEKARGLILACRAVPWSDCEVQPVDAEDAAIHASRRLTCRIAEITQATHDIRILRLDTLSGGPFDFTAGQYAQITFEGFPPRDFSLANVPGEDQLEFHIRHVPGGVVTGYVMDKSAPGDEVLVAGPIGTAHYRQGHKGPIIAVAGGSGLAPIKAIVEAALKDGAGQDIHLYFGVRDEGDIYLEDRLEDLAAKHPNFSFTILLSEPSGKTARRTGFLSQAIADDFSDLDGFKAYLAGPPVMVESCAAALTAKGLNRRDCHADAFYTEAEKYEEEIR
ncbi:MAG: 2Fe-2S iron-sulfur cluster binding domain-containing protein [Rhodospirillales bacterium]|nr:2Fe-2S iron-sulfur cluster binding domain-containing protein [Rhodospirillales bacterium]